VQPYVRQTISQLEAGIPVIHFGTGNPALLPLQAECGSSVMGIDWRVDLDDAWAAVGYDLAVQGNLDPGVLLAEREEIRAQVKRILAQAAGRPGHIFNLGHGVLQQTPVENAVALVEMVHELSREGRLD
jgi:uroporphyrinogen decarboxylase